MRGICEMLRQDVNSSIFGSDAYIKMAEEQEKQLQEDEAKKANQVSALHKQHEEARPKQELLDRKRQEQEQIVAEEAAL